MNISFTGIWNTSIGGDSQYSSPGYTAGRYWPTQPPENVFDSNYTTAYCNRGPCNSTSTLAQSCGTQTGLFFTYPRGTILLKSFRMITGGRVSRDPIWISIEGSNHNPSVLNLGSSWTLLYNGTSGLDINPGREKPGTYQFITNNNIAFASYRILTLAKRGLESCTEIGEIELFSL